MNLVFASAPGDRDDEIVAATLAILGKTVRGRLIVDAACSNPYDGEQNHER